MSESHDTKPAHTAKLAEEKVPTISRLSLPEVDAALSTCEKSVKQHIETVKAKLTANASIPPTVLRELSKFNSQKSRLMMRRIALLIESGDSTVMELLDKLMKIKPAKTINS
jgi:hypothetical protein